MCNFIRQNNIEATMVDCIKYLGVASGQTVEF